jgi:hypothetical protein
MKRKSGTDEGENGRRRRVKREESSREKFKVDGMGEKEERMIGGLLLATGVACQ